jgi:uncharacterized protein YbbK (DUF523 family)
VNEVILVSACLLGIKCRYDGKVQKYPEVENLISIYSLIPVCPEQLGGLPTPRPPAMFIFGDGNETLRGEGNLVDKFGKNVSEYFRQGAYETLKICKLFGIKRAILKEKSPSCGQNYIYVKEKLTKGQGVTSLLLIQNGISVITEDATRRLNEG